MKQSNNKITENHFSTYIYLHFHKMPWLNIFGIMHGMVVYLIVSLKNGNT